MKQVVSVALAVCLCSLLCGCGTKTQNAENIQNELRDCLAELEVLRQENADLVARLSEMQMQQNAPEIAEKPEKGNPIDDFFDAVDTSCMNTVEMNQVAFCRANAWLDELLHLADSIKAELPLEEDRELVDAYVAAAAADQSERMNIMTLFVCADLETPQADRIMTAGTIRGVLWGSNAAQLYRDTFYQLLNVHPGACWEGGYPFVFDPAAAQEMLDGAMLPH